MAATILSVQTINHGTNVLDLIAALAAVDAVNNNKWANSGSQFLVVNNGSGGSLTVTLNYGAGATIDGQTLPNKTFAVAAGKIGVLGPFPVNLYNDASANCTVAWSTGTTITAGVFQLGT